MEETLDLAVTFVIGLASSIAAAELMRSRIYRKLREGDVIDEAVKQRYVRRYNRASRVLRIAIRHFGHGNPILLLWTILVYLIEWSFLTFMFFSFVLVIGDALGIPGFFVPFGRPNPLTTP